MSTLTTYVELEIEVEFTASKGMKATRDHYGVPEGPDDEPEIEITSIEATTANANGHNIELIDFLTKEQIDKIETEIWDKLKDA